MQISIITSFFNRLDLTRAYLDSLRQTLQGWDYEWIFIDDGSTDGTREFLRALPDEGGRIRTIFNDESRGFAVNNNAGARLARAPLLCFLNNDIVLLPGWLDPMVRLARYRFDVACVGNVQREPFTGLINHYGVYFDHESNAAHAGKDQLAPPREPYLEWPAVTAACWVIRREVFFELEGFDEGFRNGFEDVDFCLRAAARGYRHFVSNRSVIYHHVSASPGRRRHEESNVRRFQERWRASILADPRSVNRQRQDGLRYLRKHRWRPWRYNGQRLLRALGKVRLQKPPTKPLDLATRVRFKWQDWFGPKPAPPALAVPVPEVAPHVFMVVDHAVRRAGHGGVSTLVRSLAAAFGRLRAPVRPVMWQAATRSLCLLPAGLSVGMDAEGLRGREETPVRYAIRGSLYDPTVAAPGEAASGAPALHALPAGTGVPPGAWILLPEVMYGETAAQLLEYVHRNGWRLAVIFHDAMPVDEPRFFPPEVASDHHIYMRALSGADLILPVSGYAESAWRRFVAARQLPRNPVYVLAPAADTGVRVRTAPPAPRGPAAPAKVLCVSAVEPRKNHRALLAAYELVAAERPDLHLELMLVGAQRGNQKEIAADIQGAMERHPGRIKWHESVEFSQLRKFYEACDFTVYPSELEGLALPILESLWFGRPCICANFGAMAKTAEGGGCLTVDVRAPHALADAILALAGSPARLENLAAEIRTRELKTWEEYAGEILACLPAEVDRASHDETLPARDVRPSLAEAS